jgi:hypothetical protein
VKKTVFTIALIWFCTVCLNTVVEAKYIFPKEWVKQSWEGQASEELLATWGSPYRITNDFKLHSKSDKDSYIQYEYLNEEHSGSSNFSCLSSFVIDPSSKIIRGTLFMDLGGTGSCNHFFYRPYVLSQTWIKTAKQDLVAIEAFKVKETEQGQKVLSVREDSNAFTAGLRKGDYIVKTSRKRQSSADEEMIILEIRRKSNGILEPLTLSFYQTFHSRIYEQMSSGQRKIWQIYQ